jgi:uncharacterized protein (TIGR03437 family)
LGYVSPTQINALAPPQLQTALAEGRLVLENSSGITTMAFPITRSAYPSLFGWSDNHYAAALDSNYRLISPSNPAAPGQIIALFATGLGATTKINGIEYDTIPMIQGFQSGAPFVVTFAGRAPGFSGLDQINILIPTLHVNGDPLKPELHNAIVPIMIVAPGSYPPTYVSNAVMLPIK